MPSCDYNCDHCGGFDAFRTLAERDETALYPDCSTPSPRVFVALSA